MRTHPLFLLRTPPFLLRLVALALLLTVALFLFTTGPASAADGSAAVSGALVDTASWALLAGVLTPLLTSVAQQPRWSNRVRVVVSVLISIVVGVITLLANGTLNDGPQTVLSIIALVVVSSAAAYKSIWKPAGVAPAIENKTSPGAPPMANGQGGFGDV